MVYGVMEQRRKRNGTQKERHPHGQAYRPGIHEQYAAIHVPEMSAHGAQSIRPAEEVEHHDIHRPVERPIGAKKRIFQGNRHEPGV